MRASLLLLLCLCCAALTECQRRRIEHLPRLNFEPNFDQYSGYLTSTDGRRLFYWLVESSVVPPTAAPLVLWMNGGPGCSSVGGLLMTNGPFLANDRAQLDRNELAWNRLANMLYIDSPNGVGLSEPGPIDKSVLNDQFTTELNLGALLHFFSLFPEYRGRPFYIAGESYAGIYIPLLAHAIQQSRHFPNPINLKGIAVGNGLHVPRTQLILDKEFSDIMGISLGDINVESVTKTNTSVNPYNVAKPCHNQESKDTYPCLNTTGLVTYLNDEEVRCALGVNEAVSGKYAICSMEIFRAYDFEGLGRDVLPELMALADGNVHVLLYHGTLDSVIPVKVTQQLLERLPLATALAELLLELLERPPQLAAHDPGAEDGAWYYCFCEPGCGRGSSLQIGGLQKSYMRGMIRLRTVIGAGHTVPTDRPDMGLQMLTDFLHGASSQQPNCQSVGYCCGRDYK